MNETKKPEPGEWWRTDNGEILFFVGCTSGGDQSWKDKEGCFIGLVDIDRGWQHLPGCDGFDWVEQKWPKYYVDTRKKMDGFFRRDSDSSYTVVRSNGKEIRQCGHASVLEQKGTFVELTESEALARLDKKCPDCGEVMQGGHADVCPEAWVVQDRVPYRTGDQIRWSILDESEPWLAVYGPPGRKLTHGYTDYTATLHVRCRRKDLPVAAVTEQPKRREMTDEERQCADVPQGFVEITDPDHVLRRNADWVFGEIDPCWQPVFGVGGFKFHECAGGFPRVCCHVSDAPQAPVTASDGELDQFLPSTQQSFDDLHRRCSDLSGQVDRLKREIQTVVGGVEAAQDRYDRSLPVSREWLKSLGFVDGGTGLRITFCRDRELVFFPKHSSQWSIVDDDGDCVNIAESIPNRGRVIDLLKGLGVEIKVATSNLSATSDSGKWSMDQA